MRLEIRVAAYDTYDPGTQQLRPILLLQSQGCKLRP